MARPTLVRLATFVATVVAAWGVLSLGTGSADPDLLVGAPAPRDYRAQRPNSVIDVAETERLQQEARDAVDLIEQINEQIESTVNQNVTAVFDDVQALVMGDQVDPPAPLPQRPRRQRCPRRRPGPPRRPVRPDRHGVRRRGI